MNCASCHAPIPADAAFCPNCGARPGAAPASRAQAGTNRTFSGLNTVAPMRESRASVLEPGTMFADRYEVIRKLGEGGMGIVYVAKDSNTGEEMVLKLIHPDLVTGDEAVKRLMAEGLTARQIRHPNIVAVYDVAQSNGQPYFTMEFVKGGTLRSWMVNAIRSGRETSLPTAAGLMTSMLAGLAEAHRMGVIHRDLKPENVLLSGDPDAGDFGLKILDFGIAKAISAPPTMRSGGGAIGTPMYMAPEQMTSAEAVGPAADLYSLTVMLYELLMEALPQARWEPVGKSRPGIPKALDDLIEKGLSARPRSRFASAAQYEAALAEAVRPAGPGPVPDPPPIDPRRPDPPPPEPVGPNAVAGLSQRAKLWIAGGAAFVVIGVIGNMMDSDVGPGTGTEIVRGNEGGGGTGGVSGGGPAGGTGGGSSANGGQVVPPPPFNASGNWQNDVGNLFAVQHDGMNFTASGVVTGMGPVVMRGTLTLAGTSFGVFTNTGLQLYVGSGQVRSDKRHIDYEIRDQMGNSARGSLHINHAPGQ